MSGKRGGTKKTCARALVFGIVFATAVFFVTAFVLAIILSKTENPTGHVSLCGMVSLFVTAAVSGFVTSRYKGEGGVLPAVLSALFFALVMLLIGLICSKGKLPFINVINLVSFMIIGTLSAMLGRKRERKRRRK